MSGKMYRLVFDIAVYIKEHKEVTWTQLRKRFNDSNVNTLSFQLTRLLESGFIVMKRILMEPIYAYVEA